MKTLLDDAITGILTCSPLRLAIDSPLRHVLESAQELERTILHAVPLLRLTMPHFHTNRGDDA